MKQILSTLSQSGLSEKEAEIYSILLTLGEAHISDIAKHSNMSRGNVYNILRKLNMSGLISKTRKGKRDYISAVHPNRLKQIVSLRKKRFDEDFEKLVTFYEEKTLKKPKVQIFEGIESVRMVYKDIFARLQNNEQLDIFTNIGAVEDKTPEVPIELAKIMGQFMYNSKIRELVYQDKKGLAYYKDIKPKIGDGYQLRFTPPGIELGVNEQFILKDKIIFFGLQKNIYVTIIEDCDLVKTHQAMFDMAWNNAVLPE